MDPIFTEEQLNRMSREDMLSLVKMMQDHYQKQETRIQILEEKTKELEFLNAMLSDRLTLAQRKRFGASSEKYADGYTQLNLSTKTMANWIIQCADRYLQPLYDLMKEELLQSKYLHGDETRIQVIDEPNQKGSTQNWMWVYLTDEYSSSPRMVLFQYERTRAGYHPAEFLGDQFEGYFTCDGYQAYHSLPEKITVTGCMAHARRRFDEALTVLKRISPKSS